MIAYLSYNDRNSINRINEIANLEGEVLGYPPIYPRVTTIARSLFSYEKFAFHTPLITLPIPNSL